MPLHIVDSTGTHEVCDKIVVDGVEIDKLTVVQTTAGIREEFEIYPCDYPFEAEFDLIAHSRIISSKDYDWVAPDGTTGTHDGLSDFVMTMTGHWHIFNRTVAEVTGFMKFGGETAEWDLRASIQQHGNIGYVLFE